MIGVTFAGEKYCFNCHHKYKIGDYATYDFEFDLKTKNYQKQLMNKYQIKILV